MSRDQAVEFITQARPFVHARDYSSARQKFEMALSQVEPWDTELREAIEEMIRQVNEAEKLKGQGESLESQISRLNN